MSAIDGGKYISWKFARCILGAACLWAAPARAQSANALRNQLASHSRRIEQLLQERGALNAQLGTISSRLDSDQARDEKSSTQLKEQQAWLIRAVGDKNRELQETVQRQEKLLSMAGTQMDELEALENKRKLFRFILGGSVALRRLPDVQLGPTDGEASPENTAGNMDALRVDALGGIAFLPVDFNSRDPRQTLSLGGMVGMGGNGFPANVYAGLTLKMWIVYLNAGLNFRKEDAWHHGPPTQSQFWQGAWTPTVFTALTLDSEALLGLQRVVPAKPSPEGLQVDPR